MLGYIAQSFLANLRRNRSLFLLTVLGVALGVGAVLSIQIINRSSLAAFRGGMRAISGEADLSVFGTTPEIDSRMFPRVLATAGVRSAHPILRFDVSLPDTTVFLQIVGIDLISPAAFPYAADMTAGSRPVWSAGWVAVSPLLAAEAGLAIGDTFTVESGSRNVPLVVGGLIDFARVAPLASHRLAVMDIGEAQRLFGSTGAIHQIDVQASDTLRVAELADRLRENLGPGARVLTPEQRTRQASDIMGSFRLNLTALSLISLLVGLFLIHAATHASLVRRRSEFGLLRSLGATRMQVFGVIMVEASVLGVVGVALGVPLGYLAAAANIDVVSETISNLYLLDEIERMATPPALLVLAAVTGVGGAMAGALLSAVDISRTDSVTLLSPYELHKRTGAGADLLLALGSALVVLVTAWYFTAGRGWRPAGFVLSLGLLAAVPLVSPWLVRTVARSLPLRGFGVTFALNNLNARLQTTAFAVAALGVAVAMLIGITVMIASFRRTVEAWSQSVLAADIYLSPRSWRGAGTAATLDDGVLEAIGSLPGVAGVDLMRGIQVRAGDRRIFVGGYDLLLPEGLGRFPLIQGRRRDIATALAAGQALVSEPLALKGPYGPGDSILIATADGIASIEIAAVYSDYSSEAGAVSISWRRFTELFGPGPPNTAALYLNGGADTDEVEDALRARLGQLPVQIRTNRSLRTEALRIFDQTFAVTHLLQGMSLVIAVAGITLSLLVMANEQVPELALYVSLGARRRQIFGIYLGKGIAIAVIGIAIGALVGLLLAIVLVHVVNRAYFGWTMQLHLPVAAMANQFGVILAAAALASIYPASRASGVPATELSRDDF